MASDKPKPQKRRVKARRTTGRSAGISQSAFAGYGHQQPATPPPKPQVQADDKEQSPPESNTAEPSEPGAKDTDSKD